MNLKNPQLSRSNCNRPGRDARVTVSLLAVLVVACSAAAASRPASQPADPLASPARQAVQAKSLAAFAMEAERLLRAELGRGADLDHVEVLRLAAWREFGRFFSRVDNLSEGQRDTLAWLAGQPDLRATLMMAVTTSDAPERVLEVLRALRADHRQRVEEFADLAAAVCVVWDAHERFGGDPAAEEDVRIDPAEPSRVFGHFVRAADHLPADPRRLPLELLIHIVDLHLVQPEIVWAGRYGPRPNVAGAFFAVPYREGVHYERNAPAPPMGVAAAEDAVPEAALNDHSYILPNILRRGGGAHDAAYFAAEIAKANGIPSAVCVSTVDAPVAAWAGFLPPGGGRPAWDATSARYPQHVPWIGWTQDPQTLEWRSEAELTVLSGAAAVAPRDRLVSLALLKASDLAPGVEARVETLRKALVSMPVNRRGWFALADLSAAEKFDAAAMKPVEQLINDQLDRRWPEFATVVRLRTVKGRGTIEFDAGVERAAEAVRGRPELEAMVRLSQVERYREDRRNTEAVELLLKLLGRRPALSPASALAAMIHLDDLLRRGAEPDLPRLGEIYRAVFTAMPRPQASYHARTTPYWQMGWRYAGLLDEMNDPQAAAALRTMLESLALPAPPPAN